MYPCGSAGHDLQHSMLWLLLEAAAIAKVCADLVPHTSFASCCCTLCSGHCTFTHASGLQPATLWRLSLINWDNLSTYCLLLALPFLLDNSRGARQCGYQPDCGASSASSELDRDGGPVVQAPVVTNTVSMVGLAGSTWNVDVQYPPVRYVWATTVQATQGLQFPHVLLDLNRAEWLEGGGYSGVGLVEGLPGDLRKCLRILGGLAAIVASLRPTHQF